MSDKGVLNTQSDRPTKLGKFLIHLVQYILAGCFNLIIKQPKGYQQQAKRFNIKKLNTIIYLFFIFIFALTAKVPRSFYQFEGTDCQSSRGKKECSL
jgi:hypothetical protein